MTTEGPLSEISGPYFDLVCAASSRRDSGTACLCAETAHSTSVVQKQRGVFMTKLLLAIGMSLALSGAALAQQNSTKEQIVGAWSLVSVISETEDGKWGEPFGTAPKGVMIFSSAGHFSLFQSRAEIPKIAANDRAKATPEEAQAIVASTIAYYGTYSIDEASKAMSVKLEASTFANVAAIPNQKRIITALTADELKFSNPRTPSGMTLLTVWKRAAAP